MSVKLKLVLVGFFMQDFSQRLKSLRQSMGLTQKQFGALGGVTDTAQGNYESDDESKRKAPGLNYFLSLKENEIDISYLLTGKSSSNNLDAEESLILETFRNANEQSKKLILDLCRTLSGLPEQPKKKDDQDPPKSGSRQKISNIKSEGGSIDIIQGDNNIKSTTHNYQSPTIDDLKELKEYERIANIKRNDKIKKAHQKYRQIEMVIKKIIFLLSACLAAFLAKEIVSVPTSTEIEQFASLFFMMTIPSIVSILTYKEISNIVTKGFDDIRETTRNRILLEKI